MAVPDLLIDIAFTTNPGATPVWTDVTGYVRAVRVSRGRQAELDRMEAGTAAVVLDNRDQRFDPNNTSSPYAGNLLPMRRIRVRARDADLNVYPVFHGLIESWPQSYPSHRDATVTLACTDLFKSLNLNLLSGSYSQELGGARIGAVLTSAGWPAGERDLDSGQTTVQARTLEDESALDHIQQVMQTENGLFFIARDGKATFIDRHELVKAPLGDTWGDGPGEARYTDIEISYDDTDIWNDIEVSSDGVAAQTASDVTSQEKYFPRSLRRTDLLFVSEEEQLDLANYLLTRYSEPALKIVRISPAGMSDTSLWSSILDRELGDKVRVRRNPPGSGDVIEQDSFIEGMSHEFTPGSWRVTWNLSPTERATEYWILGDSTFGVLNTTTRLSY